MPTPNPTIRAKLARFIANLLGNLLGTLRLVLLLPARRGLFHFDLDQLAAALVLDLGADIAGNYQEADPHAMIGPAGLGIVAVAFIGTLAACYVIVKAERAPRKFLALALLLVSTDAVITALQIPVLGLVQHASPLVETIFLAVFLGWYALAAVRAVRLLHHSPWWRAVPFGILALAGSLAPYAIGPLAGLRDSPAPVPAEVRSSIDIEQVYDAQHRLVRGATDALSPHVPGQPNFYFIGFAGWAGQDVFLKEARFARTLFDRKFGTAGRSLTLANNPATIGELPLASITNLDEALGGMARKMDPSDDMLVLFLTSHGAPGRVAVRFDPLGLDQLSPEWLKATLDRAQIKWRVIVVSACYSGGFVDALKDENTLVVTAARRDRTSFGCNAENDFTYFGEAYFAQALQHTDDLVAAFDQARATIAAREAQEKLTPSEPQIYVGQAIRGKLASMRARSENEGDETR